MANSLRGAETFRHFEHRDAFLSSTTFFLEKKKKT